MVEQQRQAAADGPRVEVIDRRSYETMQRLAGAGALPSSGQGQELFRSDRLAASAAEQRRQRLARSAEVLGAAERKLRMALLLAEGGFAAEAMPALDECVALAANARSLMAGNAKAHDTIAAEPPALHSLDDIAGAIGRLLGDISRSLRPTAAAACGRRVRLQLLKLPRCRQLRLVVQRIHHAAAAKGLARRHCYTDTTYGSVKGPRRIGSEPSSMCNAPANCRRGLTTHTTSGSGVPPRHRCRSASMTDARRERPGARTARTSSSLLAHEHRKNIGKSGAYDPRDRWFESWSPSHSIAVSSDSRGYPANRKECRGVRRDFRPILLRCDTRDRDVALIL